MLKKDPNHRITMQNVLKHMWCSQENTEPANFSPVMSYPIIKHDISSSLTPTVTTMTKYLDILYGKELELHNLNFGMIENTERKLNSVGNRKTVVSNMIYI